MPVAPFRYQTVPCPPVPERIVLTAGEVAATPARPPQLATVKTTSSAPRAQARAPRLTISLLVNSRNRTSVTWSPRPASNREPSPHQVVFSPSRIRVDLNVRSRFESRPLNSRVRYRVSSLASYQPACGQSNLTREPWPSQQLLRLPR